jgi:hypothetical protein
MRRRWKDRKGRIYEWDSQRGRVETFNSQGTIHILVSSTLKQANKPNLPKPVEQPQNREAISMFLWISGFLPGDNEDDSLKYELNVPHEFERKVLDALGWTDLENSPEGDWLLNTMQVQQIAKIIGESLPADLDLFIGVTA